MDLMANGKSALIAFQRALVTTSHNIANAQTEGFTRQEVDLQTRITVGPAAKGVGSGVDVGRVMRMYDEFLTTRVRNNTSSFGQADVFGRYTKEIDQLFGNPETGISSRLSSFFSSLRGLADDPSSIPQRQGVVAEAQQLAGRFKEMDSQLRSFTDTTFGEVSRAINDINHYATGIADLNRQIKEASGMADAAPNDLMDRRDLLITRMSELTGVITAEQFDGTVNVYMGNGQSLVIGDKAERLSVTGGEFGNGQLGIAYISSKGPIDVTDQMAGGRVGGLLQFKSEVIDPARNELGRIAISLTNVINTQHAAGLDLNGNPGGPLFASSGAPVAVAGGSNTGTATISATITAPTQLTAADYTLSYQAGVWSYTRSDTKVTLPLAGAGPFVIDGVTIAVSAGAVDGDKFLVRPTNGMASNITAQITDPRAVAAAGPTGGSGNNENALALAGLQNQKVLDGGMTSLDSAYANLVSKVGTMAYQAGITLDSNKVMLEGAKMARDEVSGVNLDEEAANLLKYQQAYQAAAKMIAAADNMFQSLMSAVGTR